MSEPTVASLQKKIQQGSLLQDYIEGQVTGFDHIINSHATRYGRNMIQLSLPTAPDIAGLERSDAQRVLYAHLIGIYCRRGFDARLKMDEVRATLLLFFDVVIEASVDASMSRLLQARDVNPSTAEGNTLYKGLMGGTEPLRRDVPREASSWLHLPQRPIESSLGPAAAVPAPPARPMRAPDPPKDTRRGGAGGHRSVKVAAGADRV